MNEIRLHALSGRKLTYRADEKELVKTTSLLLVILVGMVGACIYVLTALPEYYAPFAGVVSLSAGMLIRVVYLRITSEDRLIDNSSTAKRPLFDRWILPAYILSSLLILAWGVLRIGA